MNRLGAWLLLLFVGAGMMFALMLRPAPPPPDRGEASDAPPPGRLVMPVLGVPPSALTDMFGDPRGGGTRAHGAQDIMAPRGTPVVAAAAGTVEKIFESGAGGHTVYVRSDDGTRIYYYAHLDRYAPGLAEGQRVAAGAPIGTVGFTGNASPDGPHLHFEVKRMNAGERWYEGAPLNPYPLLTGKVAA